MDGLLIFDASSDLVYRKLNDELKKKFQELSPDPNDSDTNEIDDNAILQIFSPIINSQKIMFCQFDNTYSSFKCEYGNFVFGEYLGFMFIKIGQQTLEYMNRCVLVSISFAKRLCGTNLISLKQEENKRDLFTDLIDMWEKLYQEEQSFLLDGIDRLIINADVTNVINQTLQNVIEKLQQDPHSQRCHAFLFVDKKLAGIHSSRSAQKTNTSDIIFLFIINKVLQSKLESKAINIQSHLFFLNGKYNSNQSGGSGGCIPHIVHTSLLDKMSLTLIIEYGNLNVSNNIYETFFALQKIQTLQMQGDLEHLKTAFDNLESCFKQCIDAIRKAKFNSVEIDNALKKFSSRWDVLRKKYQEYFKNFDKSVVLQIESNMPIFLEELKELFKTTCSDCAILDHGFERVLEISTMVEEKLLEFSEFLSVKAQRNLSIGSYLEDFPGLVHFIFVDRTNGSIFAPDFVTETYIAKEKIWSMVELCRYYLVKGHTSIMWKDTSYNYSYFLWFEDQNGITIKPKDLENSFNNVNSLKPRYEPGILGGNFFQRLSEVCFPKMTMSKIRCYELFCIHLGLVTATCALDHSRRLIATISDVTGPSVFDI
ncbi:BLOC-3 complex member HPS1 [Condylostylus longicornis]|uniref:BLOC-3 complex member HPS1 n=1 Tax=Condylostylus longicornis TaxID=2530218 RepID=UPI00244E2464|nr:BLOC-3 complex member HPS1 [Condylostylus longicornis]